MQAPLKLLTALLLVFAALSLTVRESHAATGHGPGFDCAKASTRVEKAICADPVLSRLDQKLSDMYQGMMGTALSQPRNAYVARQRQWLAWRDMHCPAASFDCLANAYLVRIGEYKWMQEHPPSERAKSTLHSGQTAILNGMYVYCLSNGASVEPYQGDGPQDLSDTGRRDAMGEWLVPLQGPLFVGSVDCRLQDGTTVRVKTGLQSDIEAYGECGGAPAIVLSAWINKRKVASGVTVTNPCEEPFLDTLVIKSNGIHYCLLSDADTQDLQETIFKPAHGTCGVVKLPSGANIDRSEFPTAGSFPAMPGTVTVSGPQSRLCADMLLDEDNHGLPEDSRSPTWISVSVKLPQPDLMKLDYNATTLSFDGYWEEATFDLTNTGKPVKVYMVDRGNHWFDGTAYGVGGSSVLVRPFDAHDWDSSVAKGIFTFTYSHASVFMYHGTTYLYLHPVNTSQDSSVISLHGREKRVECVFNETRSTF